MTITRNSRFFLKIYVTTVLNKSKEPVQKYITAVLKTLRTNINFQLHFQKRELVKWAPIKLPVLCWLFHENCVFFEGLWKTWNWIPLISKVFQKPEPKEPSYWKETSPKITFIRFMNRRHNPHVVWCNSWSHIWYEITPI